MIDWSQIAKACTKIPFPSQRAASKAARRAKDNGRSHVHTLRVYQCPECHQWHMTSWTNVASPKGARTKYKRRELSVSKRKDPVVAAEPDPKFMTITPPLAEEWLDLAIERNRHPRETKIKTMADDMIGSRWLITGEAIKFNTDGQLFDGQHRLSACVLAQTNFRTLVIRNLPVEAMQAVDQGTPRTMADYLRWRDETDVFILSSIIRLAYLWQTGRIKSWNWKFSYPSNPEAIAWFDQHKSGIREALVDSRPLRKRPLYITPSVAGTFYWIARQDYPEQTEEFIHKLAKGVNLGEGHPVLRYRDFLVEQQRLLGQQLDAKTKLATLLMTFKWTLQGRTLDKDLQAWRPTAKEEFPELPAGEKASDASEPVAAGSRR